MGTAGSFSLKNPITRVRQGYRWLSTMGAVVTRGPDYWRAYGYTMKAAI